MIIDNLPTIPSTVTTGDELPVERGTTTYKIDYDALAAAILAQAVKKTGDTMTGSLIVDASASGDPRYILYGANGRNWTLHRDDSTDLIFAQWGDGVSWRVPLWIEWGTGKVRMASPLDVSQGGTGATTPIGALANLCTGIPVSAYSLPTYAANVQAVDQNNGVRCIKYGNGMKRIMGVMSISGTLASNGLMFTLPNDFNYLSANNGGIQGWTAMFGGSKSWIVRVSGTSVYSWEGSAIPAANYSLDFCYF